MVILDIRTFDIVVSKTTGLRKLTKLLSNLAKRYGEGLNQKVQLVALVLSRRVMPSPLGFGMYSTYWLNVGVAVVAPEEDGYRPLSAVVLGLKTKTLKPPGPGEDYPADYVEYGDDVINYPYPEDVKEQIRLGLSFIWGLPEKEYEAMQWEIAKHSGMSARLFPTVSRHLFPTLAALQHMIDTAHIQDIRPNAIAKT
ncbi:hypothetical protein DdX_17505 [Ditylenchus destructor]|uniref:Uncharacterized protein n=1 Tax=Ditylenchus destructor TaxID=166010 RepID=A0AAD4MMF0_9BILA|nr:hypothetical protein DdX_17505 [Ditylenchus destructor]